MTSFYKNPPCYLFKNLFICYYKNLTFRYHVFEIGALFLRKHEIRLLCIISPAVFCKIFLFHFKLNFVRAVIRSLRCVQAGCIFLESTL